MLFNASRRRGAMATAALSLFAAAILVLETTPLVPFRIERAVACRGELDGEPLDPGRTFEVGRDKICVWFTGSEASYATPVRSAVWLEDPPRLVATCDLVVPRRSSGGLVSLTLKSGSPLPKGKYVAEVETVDSRATVRFDVVAGHADVANVPGSGWKSFTDEQGAFSLPTPPAWECVPLEDAQVAFVHSEDPLAIALVFVRREQAPTQAAAIVEAVAATIVTTRQYRISSRSEALVQERRAAVAVLVRDDGAKVKIVLIPRETGPAAWTFYGLLLTSAGEDFQFVESDFDRMVSGFRVLSLHLP